jgi:hypothetical protein
MDPLDPDPQHCLSVRKIQFSVLFLRCRFYGLYSDATSLYSRVSSEGLSPGGNLLRLRTQDTPTRERREQGGGLGVIDSGSAIRENAGSGSANPGFLTSHIITDLTLYNNSG